MDQNQLLRGIKKRDRLSLARALSLMEAVGPQFTKQQIELLDLINLQKRKKTMLRIGITGSPGVGKSTLIEALGLYLIHEEKKRLAVLAVDPASSITGGSILGDKTRMEELSKCEKAFIRPISNSGEWGGVPHQTLGLTAIFEAANFDYLIIESVGVGQAEFLLRDMVDLLVLVIPPGGGDDLQAIKRGILECTDLILINKAEEENLSTAQKTLSDYQLAFNILKAGEIENPLLCISALEKKGMKEVWSKLEEIAAIKIKKGSFKKMRKEQNKQWSTRLIQRGLYQKFLQDCEKSKVFHQLNKRLETEEISPLSFAEKVLKKFLKK